VTDTVVVTGAAGFVGAHLVRALVHQGHRVVATDLSPGLSDVVLQGLDGSGMVYVPGDLRDDATLDALVERAGRHCDVVHVAALLRFAELARALGEGAPSPAEALEVFDVNAMGSWRLCSRFVAAGSLARFIHISTRSVFGALESAGETIVESSPQRPLGIYGSSKTAGEVGLLAFRDAFGLDLVVARITGVFGPWQTATSWVAKAVDAVSKGEPYRTDVGGADRYELTYVKDTVRGVTALLDAETLEHPIYHLSSGRMHSLFELAEAFRVADPESVVEFGPGGRPEIRLRKPLDGSRAADELGFCPAWGLDAAIADYLAVERSGFYGVEAVDVGDRKS
jgi:UDP-glucuronate 4-epimerase